MQYVHMAKRHDADEWQWNQGSKDEGRERADVQRPYNYADGLEKTARRFGSSFTKKDGE